MGTNTLSCRSTAAWKTGRSSAVPDPTVRPIRAATSWMLTQPATGGSSGTSVRSTPASGAPCDIATPSARASRADNASVIRNP